MAIRVYFNQWFSSIAPVIDDLRNRFNGELYVVGSSTNANHAYKESCDKFYVEEDLSNIENKEERDKKYIELVLTICTTENIDVFFVRKNAELIAKNIKLFENFGIKVITESASTIETLNSKCDTYEALTNDFERLIPNYINTKGLSDVVKRNTAYSVIKSSGRDGEPLWCLKFDTDEGGGSYRLIENDSDINFNSLKYMRFNRMAKSEAKALIDNCTNDEIDQLIFMEHLVGPEISVDCYNSTKGFIAICREKIPGTRYERIYHDKELYGICKRIASTLKLKSIFNVQFMYDSKNTEQSKSSRLRLLEINARMSGGTYYQNLIGLNLAYVCLKDVINDSEYNIDDYLNFEEKTVTHIEKAMVVNQ